MLNVMPDENKPKSTYDILQLVSKNKVIPDFLHTLTLENSKVLELAQAIKQGDASSVIWSDPNCNLYLLYLMEQNIIPFWEVITAYAYLMAKMQYTSTQNVREEDADIKLDYKIVIEPLVKDKQITELGANYLQGVCDGLEKIGFIIKVAELKKYVLKLPPIEQWLIRTEFNHHAKDEPNSDRLMRVLLSNLPFLQKTPDSVYEDSTTRYLVPSSSLINFLLNKINSDPMQMKPILGNIGLKKLYEWHEADFHPVALYATQIKSNPKEADGHRCGPFPMWLHDVAHTFWASMLSKEDRLFIFKEYIPALKILHQEAEYYGDKGAVDYLEEAIKRAYDFDLTDIRDSADKKTRLNKYIRGTFSKSPFSCIYGSNVELEFKPIGGHPGDGLYFLLNKFSNDLHCHKSHQDIYRTILGFIPTGQYYRQQSVVDALRAIAKNASKNSNALFTDNKGIYIDKANWTAWSELLNSPMTNEEIWNKSVNYDYELDINYKLTEILRQGVNLFYPYLPLTDHKREQFKHFVQEQLDKKSSPCNYSYQSGSRESFFSNDIRRYSPLDKVTYQSHNSHDLKAKRKTPLTVAKAAEITKEFGTLDAPALIATLEAFDVKNINVCSSGISLSLVTGCLSDLRNKLSPLSKSGALYEVSIKTDGRIEIDRRFPKTGYANKHFSNLPKASLFSLPIPVEEENQANSSKKSPECSIS